MQLIILCVLLILGTHIFMKKQVAIFQIAFWKLLLVSCVFLLLVFILSVELNNFYPIIISLVILCTMLQVRFLQLFQRGK
ncbi:hypothetical protein DOK78_000132 [Enterococcus sp. DIV2402]|jgi:hypothetical protein|uniref:Uncharacterized protein n=1 Tax=Candidatus Enterococcus lowellii TaxID=2230877 RepID=A0ABZ2SI38_9ENTE